MNDYVEVRFEIVPCSEIATDLVAAMLCDCGYESFVPDSHGVTAYVKRELYSPDAVTEMIENFPVEDVAITHHDVMIEGRDWNSEWEKHYFKPIVIGNRCVIHSSFHTDVPSAEYDIVIDPKMAFGTGHHQTTSLIIEQLLDMDLNGRMVLDMGTGTGILAILSSMRGASPVIGIEIDPAAQINAMENVKLNAHPEIKIVLGDASSLALVNGVDLFIANINRNIITADISAYAETMKPDSVILLSGFYVDDIPIISDVAKNCGLEYHSHTQRDNWACVRLVKIKK